MTVEKKILIAPMDVISVGFDCPHCHAIYTVPVERVDRAFSDCPNCNQRILSQDDGEGIKNSPFRVLTSFIQSLKILQRNDFGTSIRLEIRPGTDREVK